MTQTQIPTLVIHAWQGFVLWNVVKSGGRGIFNYIHNNGLVNTLLPNVLYFILSAVGGR